jgi:hypothetical protein
MNDLELASALKVLLETDGVEMEVVNTAGFTSVNITCGSQSFTGSVFGSPVVSFLEAFDKFRLR